MRRGSVIGPLILIGLGVLFLFRNLWPDIPADGDLISRYWRGFCLDLPGAAQSV